MPKQTRRPKKIEIPEIRIKEFTPQANKQFNQALSRYAEVMLRKQAGESIADMYDAPVLKIKGISVENNAHLNSELKRQLEVALEKASAVAIAPIVVGIVGGIVGNIVGNIINDVIVDECAD